MVARLNLLVLGTATLVRVQSLASLNLDGAMVYGDGNKVGVGREPRATLDVNGWAYMSADMQFQITGDPGSKGLQMSGSDTGDSFIGTMGDTDFLVRRASVEKLRVGAAGTEVHTGLTVSDGGSVVLRAGPSADSYEAQVKSSKVTASYSSDYGTGAGSGNALGSQLLIMSPDGSNTAGITIETRETGRSRWDILNVHRNSHFLGDLVFRARSSSISSTEAMRLSPSGRVGMGGIDAWGRGPLAVGFNGQEIFRASVSSAATSAWGSGAPPYAAVSEAGGMLSLFTIEGSRGPRDVMYFQAQDRWSASDGSGIYFQMRRNTNSDGRAHPTLRIYGHHGDSDGCAEGGANCAEGRPIIDLNSQYTAYHSQKASVTVHGDLEVKGDITINDVSIRQRRLSEEDTSVVAELKAENEQLKTRLGALEALVKQLLPGK